MTSIYVLRLETGKFYVGKSKNVADRCKQHWGGNGSAWTKKYKPIAIEETVTGASPFDEDKITKEYMAVHGIDNVRGGSYSAMNLSEFHRSVLKMELRTAHDLCMRCGRASHFMKDCYAKTDADGAKLKDARKKLQNVSLGAETLATRVKKLNSEEPRLDNLEEMSDCDCCTAFFAVLFECGDKK